MDDHGQWLLPAGKYAPRRNSRHPWPKKLRRWLAGIRQLIETVYDMFRLCCERPHALDGFWASLAAKIAFLVE